jgi:murein DD-endopeptidase MepM/ murein hydrolase activator NlpD
MISPTGKGVRGEDVQGAGKYGTVRKDHFGKKYFHCGADYICTPGQEIYSPVDGEIVRIAFPYATPYENIMFSGVLIRASYCELKMFYFEPLRGVLFKKVEEGQVIGAAQDISVKYEGITPHIHLEITSINPEVFINI